MENVNSRHNAWQIMAPVKGRIRLAMLLSSVSSLMVLFGLYTFALAIQTMMEAGSTWPTMEIVIALGCVIAAYLCRLQAFSQSHYAAFRLESILRTRLCDHLSRVSMGFIQQFGASKLSKVIQEDVKELHVFVADSTPLYARAFIAPIFTLIGLMVLDWRLTLAIVALLVGGIAVLAFAMRNHSDLSKSYMETREQVSAAVVEYVQAMPVVRTFETGSGTFARYTKALDKYLQIVVPWYRSVSFSSRFSLAVLHPMPTLLVLVWVGTWLIWNQQLDLSTWVAVLLIGTGAVEAITPLISLQHLIEKAKMSVMRIEQLLNEPELSSADKPIKPKNQTVKFANVAFQYDEKNGKILNDISFTAQEGSVTALVGASGSGKTTLAQLIPRFWDVMDGQITIGGVDIRSISNEHLMAQVAFVFQDTFLFAQSIADNIRMGDPTVRREDVIAAAKVAQAHEFICQLPQGYDTNPGERGVFLSGGQKQRITIARAVLQNRPILVLDEATAFADPENEAAIIEALSHLMKGKTVIMVAHRLNTIQHVDQIVVLEKGCLVESGKHQQLLESNGIYARLWHRHIQAQSWVLQLHSANDKSSVSALKGNVSENRECPCKEGESA